MLLDHKGGKNLMDENDRYGYIPLHIAARRGFADCVEVSVLTQCVISFECFLLET